MATQKVRPDPGAMERQFRGQRRRTVRRKAGVYGLAAAIAIGAAIVAANMIPSDRSGAPLGQPSSSPTAPGTAATAGTVTWDGTTCSMELTADRIEPGFAGFVDFAVVNGTGRPAMFDTYELQDGYTLREFEAVVDKQRRANENGKPGRGWPEESEVRYLSSDIIPANSSGSIFESLLPGRHAIVCMRPTEGLGGADFGPFGIVGPIVVR